MDSIHCQKNKIMKYQLLNNKTISAEKLGSLSFFEATKDIPFEIKRIYYIYDAPKGTQRGGHAHRNLHQVLFCPFGKIEIILDDAKTRESVMLDTSDKGLVIGPGLWREMIWHTDNAVLCVAASEYYDAADYIRSYDDFLEYKKEHGND